MADLRAALIAAIGLMLTSCTSAPQPVPPPEPLAAQQCGTAPAAPDDAATRNQWKLSASDDFRVQAPDTRKWGAYDGVNASSGEHWNTCNITINGDGVVLHGQADGSTAGMAWNTNQTYGAWQVRARFPAPADPGFNPVFLLWPANDRSWPAAGELDFAEIYDPARQYVEGWVHYGTTEQQDYSGRHDLDLTQWHNYAVEWRADHVTYLIDGQPWWTTTSHIPKGPMHLVLQLNNKAKTKGGQLPTTVEVAWVRIYR